MKSSIYKFYEHIYADTDDEFQDWYQEVRSTTHNALAEMDIERGEVGAEIDIEQGEKGSSSITAKSTKGVE